MSPRARTGLAFTALALVSALPFAHGLALGRTFYFRDLALHFIPLRLFALQGLRAGELRYWNPYLHQGTPAAFPPLSYPLDLLQLARPDAAGISLVLALHVPLAALFFALLARSRGASVLGAVGGGAAYALGGFCLSALNLYVYLEAMAWAPVVIWALGRAAAGGVRDTVAAAAAVAVAASTLGVEIVAQALVCGFVLAFRRDRPAQARLAGAAALGLALAAPVLLPLGAIASASQRGAGFATDVVLAHSVHPLTWPQLVIAGWHGDPMDLANTWWGSNFFPRGFPYILSLYVGAAALSLAAAGIRRASPGLLRLLALGAVAAVVCLGTYAGLAGIVSWVAPLRAFRYPTKAFFTVHLVIALLAAHGITWLEKGEGDAARRVATAGLTAGALLCGLGLLAAGTPAGTSWFLAGFTPPEYTWAAREDVLHRIVGDAAIGGLFAAALGLVGLLVSRRHLAAPRGAALACGLLAADLLRAGAGLNPQVEPAFLRPSGDLAAALPSLRTGGRVFTCAPHESQAYWRARHARPAAHATWTFATHVETLTPETNVPLAVATAQSEDFTSLIPAALAPREGEGCADIGRIEDRLRQAAVAWVVSLDPLQGSALELRARFEPPRIAPLVVHLYALRDPWPRAEVVARDGVGSAEAGARVNALTDAGDRVNLVVEAPAPAAVVLRDAWFAGWTATVNGQEAPVDRAEAVHKAVPIGPGRSHVTLRYRPPGLKAGLVLAALSGAAALALFVRGRPRPAPPPEAFDQP